MENDMRNTESIDIRLLLATRGYCVNMEPDQEQYIEIIGCDKMSGRNHFYFAYEKLQELDKEISEEGFNYIQRITLLGKDRSFWMNEINDFCITFIKLTVFQGVDYSEFERGFQKKVLEYNRTKDLNAHLEWALYYSTEYYDLVLFTKNIQYDLVQDIIRKLDLELKVIGNTYIISCRRNGPSNAVIAKVDEDVVKFYTERDEEFENVTMKALKSLLQEFNRRDYAFNHSAETMRSLKLLLTNRFPQEFVISILLSVLTFLHNMIHYTVPTDLVKNKLERVSRIYLNTLNTLMYSLQYCGYPVVQTLSGINTICFNVPQKLLAMYTAISYEIVNKLKEAEETAYSFIISPDYRQDINVVPLEIDSKGEIDNHLAIVYLCEEYLHNPTSAIKLLCHEIGHYVGNRKRENRIQHIFCAISFQLLSYTPLSRVLGHIDPILENKCIMSMLADELGSYMVDLFTVYNIEPIQGIEYHLTDVCNFLEDVGFGFQIFEDAEYIENIQDRWRKRIYREVIKGNDSVLDEVNQCMGLIEKTLYTEYFTELLEYESDYEMCFDILVRRIVLSVRDIRKSWLAKGERGEFTYSEICKAITLAFSEAFADLQIMEIMGEMLTYCDYEQLLDSVGDRNRYQNIIRHDAVLNAIAKEKAWERRTPIPQPGSSAYLVEVIQAYTVKQLTDYLLLCKCNNKNSSMVKNTLEAFSSNNVERQFEVIQSNISSYRKKLIERCIYYDENF